MGKDSVGRKRAKRLKQKMKKKVHCKRLLFPVSVENPSVEQLRNFVRRGSPTGRAPVSVPHASAVNETAPSCNCLSLSPKPVVSMITPPPTSPDSSSTDPKEDESFYSAESSDEDDLVRWKDSREAHAKIRKLAHEKQLLLADSYASHTDSSPAILESNVSIPNAIAKLSQIDRTTVRAYINEIEKAATRVAQIYRSRTDELKQACLSSAYKEREGVRYFWRQQILEGCTRSGRMVRAAIMDSRT